MPFDRTALRTTDRLWLIKLILRTLLVVCALIGIGTYAWIASTSYSSYRYYGPGRVFELFSFIPVSDTLSTAWTPVADCCSLAFPSYGTSQPPSTLSLNRAQYIQVGMLAGI